MFSLPLSSMLKNVILKLKAENFSETYYLYIKLYCFIFNKTAILMFFMVLLSTQNWDSNWNRCHEHCTYFSHQNLPINRCCITYTVSEMSVHKLRSKPIISMVNCVRYCSCLFATPRREGGCGANRILRLRRATRTSAAAGWTSSPSAMFTWCTIILQRMREQSRPRNTHLLVSQICHICL